MKVKNLGDARRGFGLALSSGLTWGIDTVLIGIILLKSPFVDSDKAILLAPFISTFMHDFFSSLWITIYHGFRGELPNVIKAMKTRSGKFIMLAALLGGPLGMTCYMLSVKYIGAAYAASVTSVYPAAGAVFAFVFLKEKLNKRVCAGIALSVTGVICIGYAPGDVVQGGNFLLGILFAFGTVLGWGLESVICAYGMKNDVTAKEALNIRQLTSAVFYGIIILPILGGYGEVAKVMTSKTALLLALTALVGTTSYMFYYNAIDTVGAARSTSLNITYAMWAIVIQIIFLHSPVTKQFILGSIVVLLGSILVAGNPKEMLNLEDLEQETLEI